MTEIITISSFTAIFHANLDRQLP